MPGCGMMPRRGMMQRRGMMGRGMGDGGMMGRHHMMHRCMQNLGLSDKQREEIEGIRMATMKDVIHRKADMRIAQLELMDLLRKDHVDMNAVVAKVKKIEGLRSDIHIALIKAREEVRAKLTPDQRQKMRDSMGGCFMMGNQWSGDTDEEMEMQTPMERQDEEQTESEQMEEVH
jgi:Spy/CpxP family protein refolding chaperone